MKMKTVVRYRMTGEAESHSRTLIGVRDLFDVSDEPEVRGGTNEGLAPTEFLLAGLIACTNVISHKIAEREGFEIHTMEIGLVAQFNRLGVNLLEEVQVPFPQIELTIDMTTNGTEEQVETLQRDLPKYCAVSKVISQAGTDITTEWRVNQT